MTSPLLRPPPTASDLQIAGINAMSSVDWPGKLVATVFAQGCPWKCGYCHNHSIIDPRIPGVVDWSALADLMSRRRGLLDGVVFSGGEPTRQHALLPAMREVREWGYQVGMHTAGPYPARLSALLDEELVDWVGLDIKALPGQAYDLLAGRTHAGEKAWESLKILVNSQISDYEVRLTVDAVGLKTAVEVARKCAEHGVKHFALQEVRTLGAPSEYTARSVPAIEPSEWENVVRQVGELGFESFTPRPAHDY